MIPYLGDFVEDDVVYMMFNTFSSDDPSASCTITNLANTDVHIHKDDGLTQRNNAAGITVSTNFDGITGSHLLKIDTNDNTVAGFWVTGSDYFVRIEGTTIDGATINAVVGHFSIENRYTRGTDSAATAAALTTHDGKLDTADTVVDGIQTDLSNATDGLGALKALLDAIPTTAMRGTDNAALASGVDVTKWLGWACPAPTQAGVPKVDMVRMDGSSTSLSDFKDLVDTGYDPVAHKIQGVVLVDTTTTNTDVRGTDGANTTVPDAAGVAPTVGEIRTEMEGAGTKLTLALGDTDELQGNQGNWATAVGFSTHDAAAVKTAIEAGGSSIANILADTNELQTDWADGGRLDLLIDAVLLDTGTTLDEKLDTLLGLGQENFYIDNTTYAGTNMTGARVRIYSVAGSVGGAGDVIATYTMTATYTGSEMDTYKVVKS